MSTRDDLKPERTAALAGDLHVDRNTGRLRVAHERLSQPPVEGRVIRLPKAIANLHPSKIDLSISKMELANSHLVNPTPLFVLGVVSGVKNNAVSRLDLHLRVEFDKILADFLDGPDKGSALLAASPVDQSLVVDTMQPTGEQAPGKSHLETVQIVCWKKARLTFRINRGNRTIDGVTIHSYHRSHVFGRFQRTH